MIWHLLMPILASGSPHVLFVLVDDLGWANVGFNHQGPMPKSVVTPNLDRLAGATCVMHDLFSFFGLVFQTPVYEKRYENKFNSYYLIFIFSLCNSVFVDVLHPLVHPSFWSMQKLSQKTRVATHSQARASVCNATMCTRCVLQLGLRYSLEDCQYM